jgi:hypothetical protein
MSSETEWRWVDPNGQQRLIRTDELLAALANGTIPSNAPVWKKGWDGWKPANETPELMSSALAAQNGLVPNIPPPPAFVVAAQTAFEGNPISESQIGAGPPPPPRYVPAQTLSPPAHGMAAPPHAAEQKPHAAKAAPKSFSKMTVMGLAPMPHPIASELSPAPVPAATSSATLVEGRPRIAAGHEANSAVNLLKDSEPRKYDSPKTVVGIPSIEDPRARKVKSVPPPAPAMRQTPPMPSGIPERDGDGGKSLKRQTLILYGGAPSAESPPPTSTAAPDVAPPIVVPGPGAQAGKNAVTRPPPWGEGAVGIGPAIPKSALTPRMDGPPRAKEDSSEELSDSSLLDSRSMPPPLKPRSLPPPAPKLPPPHNPPGDEQGGFQLDPAPVASAEDTAPHALRLPTESLYDRVRRVSKTNYDRARGKIGQVAQERMPAAKAKIDAFAEGKPRFFLPVVGGLSLLVVFIFFGMTVNALRSCGSDEKDSAAVPSASAPSASVPVTPLNAVTPARPTAVVDTTSPPCVVAGPSKTLAGHALVPSGIEVLASGSSVVLGFAVGPKDAEVIQIDPAKLTVGKDAHVHSADPLRRVTPLAAEGKPLGVAGDIDHKADKLQGRRTVPGASPLDLGVSEGNLVWAPHGTDKSTTLWALTGDGPAEALRGSPLDGSDKGVALAFRHASAIWLGSALGDGKTLAPRGALSNVPGLGPQVGSPTVAASGEWILVAWADRTDASVPWGLRWLRWKNGEAAPESTRVFTPPPGGLGEPIMSPSVAALGGGRFLLVWTEGPAAAHQVRAQTIDASGAFQGAALTISAEGANAGQGQAALAHDGKGVVAYLSSSGKNYEVVATPITCPH